jgi:protein SCO1/2
MASRTLWLLGIALGLAVILAVGLALTAINRPYVFQGSLIETPRPAPDFSLIDQHGRPFRLSDQQGKVALIFFGYTYCPDVCPVTLVEFGRIRAQLGEKAGGAVFVFVTVDPGRDTVETLRAHLSNFDPAIRGLRGDPAALETVWQAYGVVHEKSEVGGATGYLINHTARLYVVDRQGNLRITYPFGFPTDGIAQDVAHLIEEK